MEGRYPIKVQTEAYIGGGAELVRCIVEFVLRDLCIKAVPRYGLAQIPLIFFTPLQS